jgi:hypothetical protein
MHTAGALIVVGVEILAGLLAMWSCFRLPTKKRAPLSGARWGDTTPEMFEAMREVDALTPAVEPFLAARLPPRNAYPVRFDRPGTFIEVEGRPEDVRKVMGDFRRACKSVGLPFEIEFDPITGKTREIQ